MCLAQGPQRSDAGEAEPAAPQSPVKHSAIEPLHFLKKSLDVLNMLYCTYLYLSSDVDQYILMVGSHEKKSLTYRCFDFFQAGIYIYQLIDWYSSSICMCLGGSLEFFAVAWYYGKLAINNHIVYI